VIRVGIAGAGAFGTSLAHLVASHGRDVAIWSDDPEVVRSIQTKNENPRLPGKKLDSRVHATNDPQAFVAGVSLIVVAVHSTAVRERLRVLGSHLGGHHMLVHAVGALAHPSARRVSELVREETAVKRLGVLAGPALPQDLWEGRFASMVVASPFDEVAAATRDALAVPPKLRLYTSRDLVGVELASALASAYTISLGIADSLKIGAGARAVLLTRAIAEGGRLLSAAGADPQTFSGLSGLGNLLVRSSADARGEAPSFRLGVQLGEGQAPPTGNSVTEGMHATFAGVELAASLDVRAPVLEAIRDVLTGRLGPVDAARRAADTVASSE